MAPLEKQNFCWSNLVYLVFLLIVHFQRLRLVKVVAQDTVVVEN